MQIKLTGIKELEKRFGEIADRQIPVATAWALNMTAQDIQAAEVREMKTVFHNPTRYTLNSVAVDRATKGKLTAVVRIKDTDRLGDIHHLTPQIKGGGRKLKNYEYLLQKYGYLPAGKYTVPAKGARIDANGNMSPGQIMQILSYLRAFPETGRGYAANATARSLKRNKAPREYFIMRDDGGRPTGIYQRLGSNKFPMPVLLFVDQPQYKKRFDFHKVGEHAAYATLKKNFKAALAEVIRTAK